MTSAPKLSDMYNEFLGEGNHTVEVEAIRIAQVEAQGKNNGKGKIEFDVVIKKTDNKDMLVEDEASIMLIRSEKAPVFFNAEIQGIVKALLGNDTPINGKTLEKLADEGTLIGKTMVVENIKRDGSSYLNATYKQVEGAKAVKFDRVDGEPVSIDLEGIEDCIPATSAFTRDDVTLETVLSVKEGTYVDTRSGKNRNTLTVTGIDQDGNNVFLSWNDVIMKGRPDDKRLAQLMFKIIKKATNTPRATIIAEWDKLKEMLLTGIMDLSKVKVRRLQTKETAKAGHQYTKKTFTIM